MGKILAGIIMVMFVISIALGVAVADNFGAVDGWDSYLVTGEADVRVRPVRYYTRDHVLFTEVTVKNNAGDGVDYEFFGDVRLYHFDGNDDPVNVTDGDNAPLLTAVIGNGESQVTYVEVPINTGNPEAVGGLKISHAIYADAEYDRP